MEEICSIDTRSNPGVLLLVLLQLFCSSFGCMAGRLCPCMHADRNRRARRTWPLSHQPSPSPPAPHSRATRPRCSEHNLHDRLFNETDANPAIICLMKTLLLIRTTKTFFLIKRRSATREHSRALFKNSQTVLYYFERNSTQISSTDGKVVLVGGMGGSGFI